MIMMVLMKTMMAALTMTAYGDSVFMVVVMLMVVSMVMMTLAPY